MNQNQLINYPSYGSFRISAIDKTVKFSSEAFLKEESTTFKWLQSLEDEAILIDVGANIGIFNTKCLVSRKKNCCARARDCEIQYALKEHRPQ